MYFIRVENWEQGVTHADGRVHPGILLCGWLPGRKAAVYWEASRNKGVRERKDRLVESLQEGTF